MQPQQPYYGYQQWPHGVPIAAAYTQWEGQSGGPAPTGSPVESAQAPGPSVNPTVPTGGQSGGTQQSQYAPVGSQSTAQGSATGTVPTAGPLIDVVEHPRSVEVFIDIPGFDEDDIQLDADAQTLRILAEREGEEQSDEAVTLQRERPPRLERTVQVPVRVDVEDAEATYEAGVCHVSLPKSEAAERTHTRIGFH